MTDTDPVNGVQPSPGDTSPEAIDRLGRRTRKLVVGLLAVVGPMELVFAVTQYTDEPMTQTMTYGILPLLTFSYLVNARQLAPSLRDSERVFRGLTHPVTCILYGMLGVAGLLGIVAGIRAGGAAAVTGIVFLVLIAGLTVRFATVYRSR